MRVSGECQRKQSFVGLLPFKLRSFIVFNSQFGVVDDVPSVAEQYPSVVLQEVYFIGLGKNHRSGLFSGEPVLSFLIPQLELSEQLSEKHVQRVGDPLDHMEGIDNRHCIRKVFLHICQIWIVHVRNQVWQMRSRKTCSGIRKKSVRCTVR